jgi:renalase
MNTYLSSVVVGAGVCGLTLAHVLKKKNKDIVVLEKSKSVGGRIATRRDGEATYDHGAQFIKIKHQTNFIWNEEWSKSGLKNNWFSDEEYLYLNSLQGMTAFPKLMAQNLDIKFSEKVIHLEETHKGWILTCESGLKISATTVYLTAPVPQLLELLKTSQVQYPSKLDSIVYAKALVGLLEVEETAFLNNFSYQEKISKDIYSIANQKSKKVSNTLAFTIVMDSLFSERNFDSADEETLASIVKYFQSYFSDSVVNVTKSQLKKWRYSHPIVRYEEDQLFIPIQNNLILAGDGFAQRNILGSMASALAAARYLE